MVNEALKHDNLQKEREIRRLVEEANENQQKIDNLLNEISHVKNCAQQEKLKRDCASNTEFHCKRNEAGEEYVHYGRLLYDEAQNCQERIQELELNLKSSSDNVRALRKVNVALSEELHALRRVCAALDEQCRAATLRSHFKDDIIREMRRQLKQAKSKVSTQSTMSKSSSLCPNKENQERFRDQATGTSCKRTREKKVQFLCPHCTAAIQTEILTESSSLDSEDVKDTCCSAMLHLSVEVGVQTDLPQDTNALHISMNSSRRTEVHIENNSPRREVPERTQTSNPDGTGSPRSPLAFLDSSFFDKIKIAFGTQPVADTSKKADGFVINVQELYKNEGAGKSNYSSEEDMEVTGQVSLCGCKEVALRESFSSTEVGENDAARAQFFKQKFHATLQVLRNKEETLRVQGESLAVAEARIAALMLRTSHMRQELERKTQEINDLRASIEEKPAYKMKQLHSMFTETEPEKVDQMELIKTLQNKFSIIEELYRKCFYESAKQEELIESLRKSCVEVRQLELQRAGEVRRLRGVVREQRSKIDRCQDMATEVENLKAEITNFLHSSNNDSGMWEREESITADVAEDLQQIAGLLTQLHTLLAMECECQAKIENAQLRKKVISTGQRLQETEAMLMAARERIKHEQHMQNQNDEVNALKQKVEYLEEKRLEQQRNTDNLKELLSDAEEKLQEKEAELEELQQCVSKKDCCICELRSQLQKAQEELRVNSGIREELQKLSDTVSEWRSQLQAAEKRTRSLEDELLRAKMHCRELDRNYREKVCAATALQEQLQEAQQQGAALCAEARRVVCAVRTWMRNMRSAHRIQKEKITELEGKVSELQHELCVTCCPRGSSSLCGGECGVCPLRPPPSPPPPAAPAASQGSPSPCKKCRAPSRYNDDSASRLTHNESSRCVLIRNSACSPISATSSMATSTRNDVSRDIFPGQELLERVDLLQEALEESQKRWARGTFG